MRPGHTYHPSCDDFVETRAEMRARVAARRDASPTGLGYALTSITLTILALLSAVPGAHAQAAIDCASTTAALGTLGACQTGANAGCCAALTSWNDAGCFCDGVTTAVSQSATYSAQVTALAAACGLTKITAAAHALCGGGGGGGATAVAAPAAPALPKWAYVVHDNANPFTPAFKLTWSAAPDPRSSANAPAAAAFVVTHCSPGSPPSEAACGASIAQTTVAVTAGASQYTLAVAQTPTDPVTAFVSLHAVGAHAAVSPGSLGPFGVMLNYGSGTESIRKFVTPDASAAAADNACGTWWAPCGTVTAAMARATASGATFTASSPMEIVVLPGAHAGSGNCGVELGVVSAVAVYGVAPPPSSVPADDGITTPAPFASFNCASSTNLGGFTVKAPNPVTLSNLEIKNATRATGGGLFITGTGAVAVVTNVLVSHSKAGGAGGGIAVVAGAAATLTNTATVACAGGADGTGNEVRGGGLYVYGASTVTTVSKFTADSCTLPVENGKGAGVNVDGGASFSANGMVIKNSVSFFAGGLFIGTGCSPTIQSALVEGNTATYGAGVGAFAGSNAVLLDSKIQKNKASEWGGGVLAYTQSTLTLRNTTVSENEGELGGGAHVYVNGVLKVELGSVIEKNTASVSGGGVYLNTGASGIFQGAGTSVRENTAADIDGGGGVAINAGASAVFRDSFEVSENTAARGGGGGAVCTGAGSSLTILENVSVANNVAYTRGGGVLASRGCVVTIDGAGAESSPSRSVVFAGNQVNVETERCRSGVFGGGAVALEPNIDSTGTSTDITPTTLNARYAKFHNNSAPDGGAFFVAPSDELNAAGDPRVVARAAAVDVTNVDITSNKAKGCVRSAASAACASSPRVFSASSAALYSNVTNPDTGVVGGEGGGVFAASGTVAVRAGCVVTSNEASDSGGGVRTKTASSLFVFGPATEFGNNVARAGSGGGVAHEGLAFALIGPDLKFTGNKALDGGALSLVIEPATAGLVASRASFFFERANVSTAPASANVAAADFTGNAFFVSSVFMDANVAGRRGGGMFLGAPLSNGVFRSLIVRNALASAGASAYWTRAKSPDAAFTCDTCDLGDAAVTVSTAANQRKLQANGNEAETSTSIATEALSVSFTGGTPVPATVASAASAPAFAATLVDYYGRVAATENEVACSLEPVAVAATATQNVNASDTLELAGTLVATSVSGIVVFTGVVPRGRLGSTYAARIACDAVAAGTDSTDSTASSPAATATPAALAMSVAPMTFSLSIAKCTRGHEPVVSANDAISNEPIAKNCVACKDRSFNFDGMQCVACPPGGNCRGGDQLQSREGWWRSSPEAEILFACPSKEACVAGTNAGDGACALGYAGPVCAVCELGYRQWGKACVPCADGQTYALPILAILGVALFLYYIFREPPKKTTTAAAEPAEKTVDEDGNKTGAGAGAAKNNTSGDQSVALFSSLVFIVQCLGLLKEYDVAFPRGVDKILDALDLANFNLSALAPGCSDDSVNFYRSFTVGVLAPPMVLCTCALIYYLAERARVRHYRDFPDRQRTEHDAYEPLKRRCLRNAAWLLTLAYSGTAKTVFQLYNARRLDTGSFLRRDFGILVDGAGANTYDAYVAAGVLALLAYPVGVPLVIALVLRKGSKEGKLKDETFKQKYGFLYQAYKPGFMIWELAGLVIKCFLAAVPVFATEANLRGGDPTDAINRFDVGAGGGFALACQSTLAQAALLGLMVAIMWLRPHKNKLHSAQQATAAAVVLGWVMVLGNVLNVDSASDDAQVVAFDEEEKFRVCFAAVAATMAAILGMIISSFFAGELDASASTAYAADVARKSFYRLTSRKSNASANDDAERGETKRGKKADQLLDEETTPRSGYGDELNSSTVEVRIAERK